MKAQDILVEHFQLIYMLYAIGDYDLTYAGELIKPRVLRRSIEPAAYSVEKLLRTTF